MTKERINDIGKVLDVKRTDELFDASIKSADAFSTKKYTEESRKNANLAVRFGNLHVKTADVALKAVRMSGYRDGLRNIKTAVAKKARSVVRKG